jgi:hypothetical protein
MLKYSGFKRLFLTKMTYNPHKIKYSPYWQNLKTSLKKPVTLIYQGFRSLLAINMRRSLMEWLISFISEVTFRENSFWFLTSSLIKYSSLMTRYTDNTKGKPLFAINFSMYSISMLPFPARIISADIQMTESFI